MMIWRFYWQTAGARARKRPPVFVLNVEDRYKSLIVSALNVEQRLLELFREPPKLSLYSLNFYSLRWLVFAVVFNPIFYEST